METVKKRVRLDVDASKVIIEGMNPSPMGKILPELLVPEYAHAMRTELGNLVLLQNQNSGEYQLHYLSINQAYRLVISIP